VVDSRDGGSWTLQEQCLGRCQSICRRQGQQSVLRVARLEVAQGLGCCWGDLGGHALGLQQPHAWCVTSPCSSTFYWRTPADTAAMCACMPACLQPAPLQRAAVEPGRGDAAGGGQRRRPHAHAADVGPAQQHDAREGVCGAHQGGHGRGSEAGGGGGLQSAGGSAVQQYAPAHPAPAVWSTAHVCKGVSTAAAASVQAVGASAWLRSHSVGRWLQGVVCTCRNRSMQVRPCQGCWLTTSAAHVPSACPRYLTVRVAVPCLLCCVTLCRACWACPGASRTTACC
jgi:hypothetical protein